MSTIKRSNYRLCRRTNFSTSLHFRSEFLEIRQALARQEFRCIHKLFRHIRNHLIKTLDGRSNIHRQRCSDWIVYIPKRNVTNRLESIFNKSYVSRRIKFICILFRGLQIFQYIDGGKVKISNGNGDRDGQLLIAGSSASLHLSILISSNNERSHYRNSGSKRLHPSGPLGLGHAGHFPVELPKKAPVRRWLGHKRCNGRREFFGWDVHGAWIVSRSYIAKLIERCFAPVLDYKLYSDHRSFKLLHASCRIAETFLAYSLRYVQLSYCDERVNDLTLPNKNPRDDFWREVPIDHRAKDKPNLFESIRVNVYLFDGLTALTHFRSDMSQSLPGIIHSMKASVGSFNIALLLITSSYRSIVGNLSSDSCIRDPNGSNRAHRLNPRCPLRRSQVRCVANSKKHCGGQSQRKGQARKTSHAYLGQLEGTV